MVVGAAVSYSAAIAVRRRFVAAAGVGAAGVASSRRYHRQRQWMPTVRASNCFAGSASSQPRPCLGSALCDSLLTFTTALYVSLCSLKNMLF
ncbi:hypothetical protein PIB30_029826 [Stylosanthes scabra]|uniref:Uncharacterized protein n=1 Tax=Stylosanthes scabra TaxID=79078 RepID=A0ABU6WBM5_9FABA|nr:hypothetical protein [Stylosanthes scabra]